jgi:hypothetical protein
MNYAGGGGEGGGVVESVLHYLGARGTQVGRWAGAVWGARCEMWYQERFPVTVKLGA